MQIELVKQQYKDIVKNSWSLNSANAIEETVLGTFPTLGLAATFRKFLIEEKRYGGNDPAGIIASEAIYIRESK